MRSANPPPAEWPMSAREIGRPDQSCGARRSDRRDRRRAGRDRRRRRGFPSRRGRENRPPSPSRPRPASAAATACISIELPDDPCARIRDPVPRSVRRRIEAVGEPSPVARLVAAEFGCALGVDLASPPREGRGASGGGGLSGQPSMSASAIAATPTSASSTRRK